jgi:hypothetical protein
MSPTAAKPDRKELRTFGLSLAVVALIWAAVVWWRGHGGAIPWLIGASALLAGLALAAPVALRPVHRVWMPVAHAVSRVLTWILLTAVFFLVFVPFGALRRTFGKDPLMRAGLRPGESGWIRRSPEAADPARATKQY